MIIDGHPPDITRDILRDYLDRKLRRRERKLRRRVTLRRLAGCMCEVFADQADASERREGGDRVKPRGVSAEPLLFAFGTDRPGE